MLFSRPPIHEPLVGVKELSLPEIRVFGIIILDGWEIFIRELLDFVIATGIIMPKPLGAI